MRKMPQEEQPQIAEEFMIGNTKVRIATNYCVAPDEVQPILDRIAQRALAAFSAQHQEQRQRKEGSANENGQSYPASHRIYG